MPALCLTQESLQRKSSECCANILINNKQLNRSAALASDPPCDYTRSFILPDEKSKAVGINLQSRPLTSIIGK